MSLAYVRFSFPFKDLSDLGDLTDLLKITIFPQASLEKIIH